jgi:hypothetical protein
MSGWLLREAHCSAMEGGSTSSGPREAQKLFLGSALLAPHHRLTGNCCQGVCPPTGDPLLDEACRMYHVLQQQQNYPSLTYRTFEIREAERQCMNGRNQYSWQFCQQMWAHGNYWCQQGDCLYRDEVIRQVCPVRPDWPVCQQILRRYPR